MIGRGFLLGTVFGVPIRIDYSWLIIAALLTWSLSNAVGQEYPYLGQMSRILLGLSGALLLFGSVLAHELSHAVVALKNGVRIRGITLFIFGGAAEMIDEPETARSELAIAVAGPAMSLALALVFGALHYAGLGLAPLPLVDLADLLKRMNLLLVAFNLVPGFPLDGGRVLRAMLWGIWGKLSPATRAAAQVGSLFGALLVAGGPIGCPPECTINGSAGNDRGVDALIGTEGPDVICGLGGNDEIYGLGGDDRLFGGDGDDDVYGGDGNDLLFGGKGADTLKGQVGNDTLRGEPGFDVLRGDGGFDNLAGGPGDDQLFGGDDSDWVTYIAATGPVTVWGPTATGAEGTDTLEGIENVEGTRFGDTLVASDTVRGMGGGDTLLGTTVDYSWALDGVEVDLAPVDEQPGGAWSADWEDVLYGIKDVIGSAYPDTIDGNDQRNTFWGGFGDDVLIGRANDDTLIGQQGNDSADGGGDSDTCSAESTTNCEL